MRNGWTTEPFVVGKINGDDYLRKKTTQCHVGREWWDEILRFRIDNVEKTFISVEVRERGPLLLHSFWIGEIHLLVRDYKDGELHQGWAKLGNGLWKTHTRSSRGHIHLAVQMTDSKFTRPFLDEPIEAPLTFDEWISDKSLPGHVPLKVTKFPKLETKATKSRKKKPQKKKRRKIQTQSLKISSKPFKPN